MVVKKESLALLFALLACLIWSGSFVIARGVHEYIPPFALAFWRWMVAVVIIVPLGYGHVRSQWGLIISHWKYFLCLALLGVTVFNSMVYVAAHHTTTHHIALISSTSPIWTLLMAGMLGIDKLSGYKVVGAVSAFLGALIVMTQGKLADTLLISWNYGDVLLLISSVIWAVYSVMVHYKPVGIHPKSLMFIIIVTGTLSLLPFYVWEALYVAPTPFSPKAISAYVYLGLGSSIIAWFSWNYSIHTIGSVKTGLVYYTIPVFTSTLAVIILGEPIELYHWIGFVLVFLGIIISNFTKFSAKKLK